MGTLLGWIIFIFALGISVMLHEFGHFFTAKLFRMKATQFFIGFGYTLWSRTKGETEYGIKAIPAGGFVKIVGMTSMEEVDPEDEPRSFRRHPAWQRLIVLAAGSFMHFVLAFLLVFMLPLALGLVNNSTNTIGTVVTCVPKTDASSCAKGEAKSPAAQVGVRPGDSIVSFAGKPIHTWGQFTSAIDAEPLGARVAVIVEHDGKRYTREATLAKTEQVNANGKKTGKTVAFLGVSQATVMQRTSPLRAITYAGSTFGQIVTESGDAVGDIPHEVSHLFAKSQASSGSQVTSVVGVGEIAGQVVSASIAWQYKAATILLIIAEVNVFIGLANLLPILPLDGGHIAVVIYERVRAWLARLRGRADPGLVDMTKLVPVSLAVFAVVMGFSLLVMLANIIHPVKI